MDEVLEFLRSLPAFYLATEDGDQPRVRPFGAVCEFEGRIYLQTGKVKSVYRQIVANPRVELCGFGDGSWLRVAATLVEDPRIEAQQALLDAFPDLKRMYAAGDGNTAVFYLTDATATFSSFTTEPKVVRF
jgi:uncharacterized pyridoxamine 5'-phosphate oxidase family protein